MAQVDTIQTVDRMASNEGLSQIRKFYENATVLITGGLGFIGRLTVEKILRSCPEVTRLYLIARPKKGKTSEERLDEIFNDILFQKLLLQQPNSRTKVTLVNGDLEKENLGISDEDEKMLINEVNIVLHMAATVRFDEKLRKAAYINIRAVRDILLMAKKMPNLKSCVHISTAYSHCTKSEVDEVFYETPISGENLLNFINAIDDEYLNSLTPSLIGQWPNTYTYTKAIAELVVRELGKELPVCIVRPSIIITTLKEPLAGWANNLYGVLGLTYVSGLGYLHTMHCNASYLADLVPADFTINFVLEASRAVGQMPNQEKSNNILFDELYCQDHVPIFNYVSSPEAPITWEKYVNGALRINEIYPTIHTIWYVTTYLNKYLFMHKIYSVLLHLIPAYIVDAILYITGKKPIAIKSFAKAGVLFDTLQYFGTRQWIFKNNNVQTLWKKLSKTDQENFEFSMANVDWAANMGNIIKGNRIYLYKDPLDTVPEARKRYFKLKVLHFTIVYLLYFGLAYLFWKILSAYLY